VVSGSLEEADGGVAERGDNLVLPYAEASSWTVKADAVVLITDQFSH
jgi:hypothetical protein